MSKKLVIKINNLAALDEDALARKHEVEQLLWGRIIGAIAVGVVLLFLAVWFVFSQSENAAVVNPDVTTDEIPPNLTNLAEVPPVDAVQGAQLDNSAQGAAVSEPLGGAPIVDEPRFPAVADQGAAVAAEALPAKTATANVSEDPLAKPSVEDTATKGLVSDHGGDAVAVLQAIEKQPKPSAGENTIVDNVEHKVKIKLLSDGIAHAQLTHSLDNEKKPVDTLSKQIRMNTEGLLRIYLYTELNGLSGTTLYHTWYLNGDRMARVRIPVVREDYRASSSKFIDTMMLGAWQVTITDDSDKLYADVSFVVTN